MLGPQADGGRIVVILLEDFAWRRPLKVHRELVEGLPPHVRVVHAEGRVLEARVAEAELDLRGIADLRVHLLGGERSGTGELRGEERVDRSAGGSAERVTRGEGQSGGRLRKGRVGAVVVE